MSAREQSSDVGQPPDGGLSDFNITIPANNNDRQQEDTDILSRPILVGYAFGPKKMSTMGVVMAEASQTALSTLAMTVLVEKADECDFAGDNEHRCDLVYAQDADEHDQQRDESSRKAPLQISVPELPEQEKEDSFSAVGSTNSVDSKQAQIAMVSSSNSSSRVSCQPHRKLKDAAAAAAPTKSKSTARIVMSLDSYDGGLQNIVRYLHSSCSSVGTNSTNTTLLTIGTSAMASSLAGTAGGSNKWGASSSYSGRGSSTGDCQHQRLRVSFVPLDPDFPLEEQHGAKMDIILHKLTEDILCLSRYSPLYPDLVPSLGSTDEAFEAVLEAMNLENDAHEAIRRVHRLMQYQKRRPDCSLVDDPSKVLTLMSRSDIAHALSECLVGVSSKSGIPVSSPKFVVWDQQHKAKRDPIELLAQLLKNAKMSYPLIAKPLQAAGTKTSHYMTVLLNESSLKHIGASSCLLQEYANHDAVLYKVYVLGNNVRVYQRPSLPNLPPLAIIATQKSSGYSPSYVDFDSQRPYPRLSAFGVSEGSLPRRNSPPFLASLTTAHTSSSPSKSATTIGDNHTIAVTAEEVQPIVDTLMEAFGLELFGFDILITPGESKEERQMLVVDVNYFPSYKEVSNFPSLLAQYLTQRAVDSRRRKPQST